MKLPTCPPAAAASSISLDVGVYFSPANSSIVAKKSGLQSTMVGLAFALTMALRSASTCALKLAAVVFVVLVDAVPSEIRQASAHWFFASATSRVASARCSSAIGNATAAACTP